MGANSWLSAYSNKNGISKYYSQRDVESDTFIVQPMDELNLLGVFIDRNLLFSNYISTACKKAGMRVSVLKRMRTMISMKVKLRICKAASFAMSDIL